MTLVYFDKEDADFLSHSTCLYSTQDWGIEVHRGEVPNGASKSVMPWLMPYGVARRKP